nr:MAG TPA: hypothetical protein [Caudoviricetes sp.]
MLRGWARSNCSRQNNRLRRFWNSNCTKRLTAILPMRMGRNKVLEC